MSEDIQLNVSADVAAAELEHFYYQNGGDYLLPELAFDDEQSHLKKFAIHDGEAEASILFRSSQNGQSVMTVNVNDTELWGWILGDPERGELGVSTYLAAETSHKCEKFCDDFVEYLNSIGYAVDGATTIVAQTGQAGRPRNKGYDWAMKEIYINNRDFNEVYLEWLEKFPEGKVPGVS